MFYFFLSNLACYIYLPNITVMCADLCLMQLRMNPWKSFA